MMRSIVDKASLTVSDQDSANFWEHIERRAYENVAKVLTSSKQGWQISLLRQNLRILKKELWP